MGIIFKVTLTLDLYRMQGCLEGAAEVFIHF